MALEARFLELEKTILERIDNGSELGRPKSPFLSFLFYPIFDPITKNHNFHFLDSVKVVSRRLSPP
ncbi:hypothetical protein QUF76_06825, partial [Desulfobacterales bacterium HSG16]|nr:hypothetical protein [Desulfobacterales bacterium HSG16]